MKPRFPVDFDQQLTSVNTGNPVNTGSGRDRAVASGAKGRPFESARAYHLLPYLSITYRHAPTDVAVGERLPKGQFCVDFDQQLTSSVFQGQALIVGVA